MTMKINNINQNKTSSSSISSCSTVSLSLLTTVAATTGTTTEPWNVLYCGETVLLKFTTRYQIPHAGSAIKVLVAIHYSVLDARNGYIRNVVV